MWLLGVAKTRNTRAHARRAARGGWRSGVGVAGRGGRGGVCRQRTRPTHARGAAGGAGADT